MQVEAFSTAKKLRGEKIRERVFRSWYLNRKRFFYVGIFGWQAEGVGVSDVCKDHYQFGNNLPVLRIQAWLETFNKKVASKSIVTSSLHWPTSFILIWISSPKTPRLINEIVESERDTKVHFISTRSSPDKKERRQEKEISRLVAPTHSNFKSSRLQPLPFPAVISQPLFAFNRLLKSNRVSFQIKRVKFFVSDGVSLFIRQSLTFRDWFGRTINLHCACGSTRWMWW